MPLTAVYVGFNGMGFPNRMRRVDPFMDFPVIPKRAIKVPKAATEN